MNKYKLRLEMQKSTRLLLHCMMLLSVFAFSISADSATTEGARAYTLDDIIRAVAIDVHPSEPIIAIAGWFDAGFGFYLYNIGNGQINYIPTSGRPRSVFWSPDGNYIVSSVGLRDTLEYQVFDTITGQMLSSVEHFGLASFDIAWKADSTQYAVPTGFSQSGVSVVNATTGNIVTEYSIDTNTFGGTIALSWHGSSLVVLHELKQVRVWNTNTETQTGLYPIGDFGNSLRISPDGTLFAIAGNSGNVEILDASTGAVTDTLISPEGVFSTSVAWSPDSATVAGFFFSDVDDSNTIFIWDVVSGALQGKIDTPASITPSRITWYSDQIVYVSDAGDKLIFADTTSSATTSP